MENKDVFDFSEKQREKLEEARNHGQNSRNAKNENETNKSEQNKSRG